MEKRMSEQVKNIKLPEDMQNRILRNCITEIQRNKEKEYMKKNFANNFKKPAVIAATLAVCFCLSGITVLAATGKLQGIFRDKTNWNGAITGQTYENATDELLLYAAVEENILTVTVDMVKYEVAPYSEIEELKLEKYKVLDAEGNVVLENMVTEPVTIENNQVMFQIPAEELAEGNYKLLLEVLSGSRKAEQDLLIIGEWECAFTK